MNIHPNAALIVVDVQRGLDEAAYFGGERNNPQAEANIARLIQAWRSSGRPLFHIKHNSTEPNSPLRPGQSGNDFKPEAQPNPGEPIIPKSVNSAFIGTDLEQQLRSQGIEQVVIVGLTTNHCVSTTTRMAGNLGFETILVSDATAAYDRTGADGTKFSAQVIHDTALASIHGEFAQVADTDTILAALESEEKA